MRVRGEVFAWVHCLSKVLTLSSMCCLQRSLIDRDISEEYNIAYVSWICSYLFPFGYICRSLHLDDDYFPIFFRVTSLALGQSCDCPNASEVTRKGMSSMGWKLTTAKHNDACTHIHIFSFIFRVICCFRNPQCPTYDKAKKKSSVPMNI